MCACALAIGVAGCGDENGDPPPEAVRGSLDLRQAGGGPPDAGTAAGHGADRYAATARGRELTVRGRVEPADAQVEIADPAGRRRAHVNVAPSGRFTAELPALPVGTTVFRVRGTAPGARPWITEVRVTRASGRTRGARGVAVPEVDRTPPQAALHVSSAGAAVSALSPVRDHDEPPVVLRRPVLRLTAIARDGDGGTGRVRVSVAYRRECRDGRAVQKTENFPPSEIARVRLAPGAEAPAERRRHASLRLEHGDCTIRGEAWADATNASGLEAFSDQIAFVLQPR